MEVRFNVASGPGLAPGTGPRVFTAELEGTYVTLHVVVVFRSRARGRSGGDEPGGDVRQRVGSRAGHERPGLVT